MKRTSEARNLHGAWLMVPQGNLRTCPHCSGNLYRSKGEPYSCLWCGREWEVKKGVLLPLQPDMDISNDHTKSGIHASKNMPDNQRQMSLTEWMPLLKKMADRVTERLKVPA